MGPDVQGPIVTTLYDRRGEIVLIYDARTGEPLVTDDDVVYCDADNPLGEEDWTD